MSFKGYGSDPVAGSTGGDGKTQGNYPLSRQPSIYSLTFDEFQSTMGGLGKDFGSMNMDELLKNIWSAEETQAMPASGATAGTAGLGGTIQRQGSLTLPRTLSQKTVDEVWRDITVPAKDGFGSGGGSNVPQKQQTFGEMTLEEFLFRAGVVMEDPPAVPKPNNGVLFGDSSGLGIGFQCQGVRSQGLVVNEIPENKRKIPIQSSNLPLNTIGVKANQQQQQSSVAYRSHLALPSSKQLDSAGIGVGMMGMVDKGLSLAQVQPLQDGGLGVVGLGAGPVPIPAGSPAKILPSEGIEKSNGDSSSVSPVAYMFSGELGGRKGIGTVEKVAERRQRRMIKNRESAARSRARKQAYTMELEAEVAKLKEENEELRKKLDEAMAMQNNQASEAVDTQRSVKKRCIRRTQTSSW